METEAPISIATQLAAMEPLCGASLAICLGYLALSRFRYRDHIQKEAAKALTDAAIALNEDAHTTAFGELYWLAGTDRPKVAETACEYAKDKKLELLTDRPEGNTAAFYDWLFRARLGYRRFSAPGGELFVVIAALFAFVTLVVGVCANGKVWLILPLYFTTYFSIETILTVLFSGSVVPVFLVLLGRRSQIWALSKVTTMSRQLQVTVGKMDRDADGIKVGAQQLEPPQI